MLTMIAGYSYRLTVLTQNYCKLLAFAAQNFYLPSPVNAVSALRERITDAVAPWN